MSAQGAGAKARELKGYLVGPTTQAVLEREVMSYPPEEQSVRMKAFLRRERVEAEEASRQHVEALLREVER